MARMYVCMYVCILCLQSCTSDLTTANHVLQPSAPTLTGVNIPYGLTPPNRAGYIHKFGLLYVNEKINYTYVDSTAASQKAEIKRLIHLFAQDTLRLSGSALASFDNSFAWGWALNDSLQHGELGSSSRLHYYLDTVLTLTTKQKSYIQQMFNVAQQNLTREQRFDSLDYGIWLRMKAEVWLPGERDLPEFYYYLMTTSNEVWGALQESQTVKTMSKGTQSMVWAYIGAILAADAGAALSASSTHNSAAEDIGGAALGASVGAATGGAGGAAMGTLIAVLVHGYGRPGNDWNPGDGVPRDKTYVARRKP